MLFISQIFCFRIIPEILNWHASVRVVGHFRGLKLAMQIVVFQMSKVVVHRIAVQFMQPDFNWHSNLIDSLNTH